jgi:hypothetical protein
MIIPFKKGSVAQWWYKGVVDFTFGCNNRLYDKGRTMTCEALNPPVNRRQWVTDAIYDIAPSIG